MQVNPTPLPKTSELVAVIGAGLAGSLSAIYLAKAGYDVILIDKASRIMTVSSKIPIHLHSGGLYLNDIIAAKHCLHDSINFKKALPFAIVPHPTAFAVMTLDDIKILPSGKTQLMEEALILYNKDRAAKDLPSSALEYLDKANEKIKREKINIEELSLRIYKNEMPVERSNLISIPEGQKGEYYAKAQRQIALMLFNADNAKKEIPRGDIEAYKAKAIEQQKQKWEKMKKGFEILQKEYADSVLQEPSNKQFGEVNNFYKIYEVPDFIRLKENAQKLSLDPALENKDEWTKQLARISDPSQVYGVVMSSEVGLNMIRVAAGLEFEINKLIEQGKITFLTLAEVTQIKEENNGTFVIKIKSTRESSKEIQDIHVQQVVNATGYRGKALDDVMGFPQDWTVDIKGAGIIKLNDDTFWHTPGVFFTEAKGMAQLSCFNKEFAGINYTTLDVAGTYVQGGVITFDKSQSLDTDLSLQRLEQEIINRPTNDPALIKRTEANITGCTRFMPVLGFVGKVTAVGYASGSLGLVGKDKNVRESKEVYISHKGYHSVNLAKGGGAVSGAMSLVHNVVSESHKRLISVVDPFPDRSKTKVFPIKFIIEDDLKIDVLALERAKSLSLSENIGMRYNKTYPK